jgi:uncharacterized protein (DUF362 family)
MRKPRVIIRTCERYDADRIEILASEALETLGLRPHGKVLIKPNVVASGEFFPHAYTRPEFVEGVARALQARADSTVERIVIGERCGITVPTRYSYREAGYPEMADRIGVELVHFEEVEQVEIQLHHPDRLRDAIYTPRDVAEADFFVNCPKFKAHPWTTVTFSMKNYIGIQDDRHRLIDHDHLLHRKVADLQYVVQPQFIAIDAIIAGEGRMLTPLPFDMGLILFGENQVAFDAVCCHIIGIDPLSVDHIRLAHEEGFGPVSLEDIEVLGDMDIEGARARAKGFKVGRIRVEDYFKGTHIQTYVGPPPAEGDTPLDYCWGGCPGALEEAIEILRVYDKKADDRIPRIHIVFGSYDGEIDAGPGEKVVFLGDCTAFSGTIDGEHVEVKSTYLDRAEYDPRKAVHESVYQKMWKTTWTTWKARNDQVVRIHGCPVSVAEQVLLLCNLTDIDNPYLDPQKSIPFTCCYISSRTRQMIHRLFGKKYLVEGPADRGAARPVQNLPPAGGGDSR